MLADATNKYSLIADYGPGTVDAVRKSDAIPGLSGFALSCTAERFAQKESVDSPTQALI